VIKQIAPDQLLLAAALTAQPTASIEVRFLALSAYR